MEIWAKNFSRSKRCEKHLKKNPKPGMVCGLNEFIKSQAQVEANFRKI